MSESKNLLEVKNLKQHFDIPNGFMKSLKLKAVDDVTFEIKSISNDQLFLYKNK